jgi:hypothetical protein
VNKMIMVASTTLALLANEVTPTRAASIFGDGPDRDRVAPNAPKAP